MSLIVLLFELFSWFIKLYLSGLSGSDLFVQFLLFSAHFNRKLLNLQIQLSDFCVILFSVFLQRHMVLLLLLASNRPLLQFLLIPVKLEFYLLNFLINSKNSHLYIIEPLLIFSDDLVEFFDFAFQSTRLSFCDLPQVIFSFCLFVFGVDECFSIE